MVFDIDIKEYVEDVVYAKEILLDNMDFRPAKLKPREAAEVYDLVHERLERLDKWNLILHEQCRNYPFCEYFGCGNKKSNKGD